ncbi:uncharacterized protein C8Q71DRAFT_392735 [Rhodofomes roseus]|uniref:DUF6533 domain-containing protein n=1 Tax=Rhodofomes roseus TaxID=34475 RepID=A0ABQ8K0D9_9APHY|nr:uncharacterized protein C8Q71DRAFT_392735 [Rhodofomes roseus]KAH9829885.1 hypothetical protein C8Q71DRAFT_392735 [Rhodofomes roseus]
MDQMQTQTEEQYTLNYCAMAGAALLLYDYVITLGQESRYIWTDVRVGYVAIFLVNRINMLGMALAWIIGMCSWDNLMVRYLYTSVRLSTIAHTHRGNAGVVIALLDSLIGFS